MPRSNAVGGSAPPSDAAIAPNRVRAPVATTSIVAVPPISEVPWNSALRASAGVAASGTGATCFSTG